jgi:hypothetical protein
MGCHLAACHLALQELPKDTAAVQAKASRDIELLSQDTAAAPQDQRW